MQPAGFELNPTFSFTLFGTFAIYLWTRPPREGWLSVIVIAIAMREVCAVVMRGFGSYFGVAWISWGAFLGLATLVVLLAQTIFGDRNLRRGRAQTFYAGLVFPLLSMLVGYYFLINVFLSPKTLDAYLLGFDGSLGFQPSFALGKILAVNPRLWNWTTIVYYALPLEVATLYGAHRVRGRKQVAILGVFLSFMTVGVIQYTIYPAVGPAHAFRDAFPWGSIAMGDITLQPLSFLGGDPRNCMPSLHFGAALLVWWNSRIWPRCVRALVMAFLLATALSTLALGEHYIADLVVALPFALIVQGACTTGVPLKAQERFLPIAVGIVLAVIWLVFLRYAILIFERSLFIGWAAILLTAVGSFALECRLATTAQSLG
jgi:PAP2 superfamily